MISVVGRRHPIVNFPQDWSVDFTVSLFALIILSTTVLTLGWWIWAHCQLRAVKHTLVWRVLLGVFSLIHLGGIGWFILARRTGEGNAVPKELIATIFIWFIAVLPVAVALWAMLLGGRATLYLAEVIRRKMKKLTVTPEINESRRRLLTTAIIAAPPLLQTAALTRGLSSLDDFRIRKVNIGFANLPRELHGVRLAHVTDIHTGRFTTPRLLRKITEATNALRADAILLTGDLIDYSLSDLPAALTAIRAMDAPAGVWMCEGNHDLFEGHSEFEERVKAAGAGLLLNEEQSLKIRGVDVQLLGQRWGMPGMTSNPMLEEHGAAIARLVDRRRFSILLAHHPHAFDPAREAGIDLTLAGHTHGGQLNIAPGLGVASFHYRYISGLYQRGGTGAKAAACFVSNGTGNWFPLRLNAPAEIVEITLRRV